MKTEIVNDRLIIFLEGRIDSGNAPDIEAEILGALDENKERDLTFDASGLSYISSAGLRILMKVKKTVSGDVEITEVGQDIYEIFETTGFTDIFDIKKKIKTMSVEGCEIIGQGAVGDVYRVDADTIVKVYNTPNAVPMIRNEQKMAKAAFIAGVPTAISYDIVKAGDKYGSVFELLKAKTFNDLIIESPETAADTVRKYSDFIKSIHEIEMTPGIAPYSKDVFLGYLDSIGRFIDPEVLPRLRQLISEIPDEDHFVHGDLQMKNVMLAGDEPMLIDMDTLSLGHRIFDLQALFVTYVEFGEDNPGESMSFKGYSDEMSLFIFDRFMEDYFDTTDRAVLDPILDKVRILAGVRFIFILDLLGITGGELGEKRIRHTNEHFRELLPKVDKLYF
ncbi:MAG: phosphotransferase [Butyrivibrio sp.]|nr:phosphotransferase [Butyrivibrio sp.]